MTRGDAWPGSRFQSGFQARRLQLIVTKLCCKLRVRFRSPIKKNDRNNHRRQRLIANIARRF